MLPSQYFSLSLALQMYICVSLYLYTCLYVYICVYVGKSPNICARFILLWSLSIIQSYARTKHVQMHMCTPTSILLCNIRSYIRGPTYTYVFRFTQAFVQFQRFRLNSTLLVYENRLLLCVASIYLPYANTSGVVINSIICNMYSFDIENNISDL